MKSSTDDLITRLGCLAVVLFGVLAASVVGLVLTMLWRLAQWVISK